MSYSLIILTSIIFFGQALYAKGLPTKCSIQLPKAVFFINKQRNIQLEQTIKDIFDMSYCSSEQSQQFFTLVLRSDYLTPQKVIERLGASYQVTGEVITKFYQIIHCDYEQNTSINRYNLSSKEPAFAIDSANFKCRVHSKQMELVLTSAGMTKRIPLKVNTQRFEMRAKNRIAPYQKLRPHHFEIVATYEPLQSVSITPDQLQYYQLKRELQAGESLSMDLISSVKIIKPGDHIEAKLQYKSMELALEVKAIQGGGIGDNIKVYNEKSKKMMTATVQDARTVTIAK